MTMTDVPAYVTRAAEQHDLGALVVGHTGSNPVTWFIGFGGLAVGGEALLYAVMWWLPRVFDEGLDEGNANLGAALAVARHRGRVRGRDRRPLAVQGVHRALRLRAGRHPDA